MLWLARARFERTARGNALAWPDDAHTRHACWDTPGAIELINPSLRVFGCRECARTHHCRAEWASCIKVSATSGATVCAFSGTVLVDSELAIGKYQEEIRVSSVLKQKPMSQINGFVTTTQSKGYRMTVRHLNEQKRQQERTDRLLGANDNADGSADADDGNDDEDSYERPKKRARYGRRDDSDEEQALFDELALFDEDGASDREEGSDAGVYSDGERRENQHVRDSYEDDDDDTDKRGPGDANEDESEDGAKERVVATDVEAPTNLRDVMDYEPADGRDGDDDNDDGGGDGGDRGFDNMNRLYERLGGNGRGILLDGRSASDSNARLMRQRSNIDPPWSERAAPDPEDALPPELAWTRPVSAVSTIHLHGAYIQSLEQATGNAVAQALLDFEEEHRTLLGVSSALAQQSGIHGTGAAHSVPATHGDYMIAVQRAQVAIRSDVNMIMRVLGASLESQVRTERINAYERLGVRLFDVLIAYHPLALGALRSLRIGITLLLELLHTPYHLSDKHTLVGSAASVAPSTGTAKGERALLNLLAQTEQRAHRILVWNADAWLVSPTVRSVIDTLLVTDAKTGTPSVPKESNGKLLRDAAEAVRAAAYGNNTVRFARAHVKTWATQLRAILQQTPITPYALRDALFR